MKLYKYVFLIRTLSPGEKRRVLFLAILFLAFGGVFLGRMYVRATVSVPAVGGVYREGTLKAPRTINPIYVSANDTDRDLVKLIFSRLVTYDGLGNPIPDLAEDYVLSTDGKTYTIHLKKNVFWQDGKKVTADDVLFTVHAIQNPSYRSPLIVNWQGVEAKKIDEYTLEFTLRAPYTPFLENLTVGILPKHLWEDVGPEEASLHELNLRPVGSGPYVFDRFIQEKNGTISEYHLARNPEYYQEGPYIKSISFLIYDSYEMLISDWRRKRIDGFNPISEGVREDITNNQYSLLSIETPHVFSVFFNPQKAELLTEKRLREAISFAIPRDEITGYILGDAAPLTTSFPAAYYEEAKQGSTTPTFDRERAQSILKNLGYADTDNDGILEKIQKKQEGKKTVETKTPLSFVLSTSDAPDLLRAAEVIQGNLALVGIDVDIQSHPLSETLSDVIRPREFELLLFGQAYGYEPDPFLYWHSSQTRDPGLNIIRYSDSLSDKLLEQIRSEPDRNERKKRIQELSDRLETQLPMLPLYGRRYLYVLPDSIKGIELQFLSLSSDRFNEINTWHMDTKRILK